MSINNSFEEMIDRIGTMKSQVPVNYDALMVHINRFVEELSNDPALNGLVIQIALTKPFQAEQYVASINIAGSADDAQSAVDALAKVPVENEDDE